MKMQFIVMNVLGISCLLIGSVSEAAEPHCYAFGEKYEVDGKWFTPDGWGSASGELMNNTDIVGGSLQLSASLDYLDLGVIDVGEEFTIDVLVKIPSDQRNIQTIIANTGPTVNKDGFKLFLNSFVAPGSWSITFESGIGHTGTQVTTPAYTFTPNRWEHIKVSVQKIGLKDWVSIFVNFEPCDAEYDPNPKAQGWAATGFERNAQMDIGRMESTWYLTGAIDRLCIMPRSHASWPASDFNEDCTVDISDLIILTEYWLQSDVCELDIEPAGGDGIVNNLDFALLASQWLMAEPTNAE